MISIWWIGFLASAVMVFDGIIHFPPYKKHTDWPEEKRACAEKNFYRLVWQEGLFFAAMTFMLMRSLVRMSTTGQYVALGIMLVVMAAAILLIDIPVRRAVAEEFLERE